MDQADIKTTIPGRKEILNTIRMFFAYNKIDGIHIGRAVQEGVGKPHQL